MKSGINLDNWYEAYRLIAGLLIEEQKKYSDNPSKNFYTRLQDTKFSKLNKGTLFRDELSRISEWGFDPIQIFATFNYPKIGNKRIEVLNSLLEEFGSANRVNEFTSFEGCPTPVITQIIQYRGWKIQNAIWKMFSDIMEGGIEGLSNRHFLSLKDWRGVDIASFTMFLYWINPDEFLPLDRNTVDFLKSFDIISARPRTFQEYFDLCTKKLTLVNEKYTSTDSFKNLVKDAYSYTDRKYGGDILSGSTVSIISETRPMQIEDWQKKAKLKHKERIRGFQIIGLRPKKIVGSTNKQKHLKNLSEDRLYKFYDFFVFNENDNDDVIGYNESDDLDLYRVNDINVSISAVVGKNGSGKSTIAEFLYLIINKIAFLKGVKSTEKLIDEEIFADLFIRLDKVYKISVGEVVEIFEYELRNDGNYYRITNLNDGQKVFENFDIETFCYSVVVNYSLYGLNTNILGEWIYPLFHKNDSYQTPIVLNPLRNEGKIDVNNEEGLAKSRLLSNILEPDLINFTLDVVPELVLDSVPMRLKLENDENKMNRKKAKYREKYKSLHQKHINKVIDSIGFDIKSELDLLDTAKEYYYLKIVDIANKYTKFKKFKNLPHWISSDNKKLQLYIKKLSEDTSHITFKLRQVVNYLKYGLYNVGSDNSIISVSKQIRDIKELSNSRTIEFIPPSFFKINIEFTHGGTFDDLSSGEKQQVFSINTIAYHIYNIASVMYDADTLKYNNINILFDEVELYFHPEMQRTYINNLLQRLSTLQLDDNIHNINILFITHSPFILSDIPSSNILKLGVSKVTKTTVPVERNEKTFGANIHDLLANDFFLENGFMGEFSRSKINSLILYLNIHKQITKLKILFQKEVDNNYQLDSQLEQIKNQMNNLIPGIVSDVKIENNEDALSSSILIKKLKKLADEKSKLNPDYCLSLIQLIGEPILEHKLLSMYYEAFPLSDKTNRETEFLALAKQLNYKVIKE